MPVLGSSTVDTQGTAPPADTQCTDTAEAADNTGLCPGCNDAAARGPGRVLSAEIDNPWPCAYTCHNCHTCLKISYAC